MDLRMAVQTYVDELCAELGLCPVPQARLIQNSSSKRSCGDFNIFIRQPSFDCLRPHMFRLVKELPRVSESWALPIERVGYSENSAYLELFLKRVPAFQRLFQAIGSFRDDADIVSSSRTPNSCLPSKKLKDFDSVAAGRNSCTSNSNNIDKNQRLLVIVHAPDQPPFDHRRSEMLALYMRTQYEACGFQVHEVKDIYLFDEDSPLSKKDYENSEYFDAAKQAFDLRRYLEDRSLETELDANLGAVYLNSPAVSLARALASAARACIQATTTNLDDVLLCHVAPQNKAYVQQQAGVLLEILECLKQREDQPARQAFVIHGGTDARQNSVDDYLQQIYDYVSNSLRHRRLRADEGSPLCSMVVRVLADTKITFELLAARQMARLKISPLSSKDDTLEGGGGGGGVASFNGKGGIFVQYTCARLAVLLSNYDCAVADGRYPTCQPWSELHAEDIDLSALSLDFDWLLWRVMFRCQTALERGSTLPCFLSNEGGTGERRVFKFDLCAHSVCEALAAACVQFSTYYSKVRVLVEAQPHLIESLKARIFLLVSLRSLLHRGLQMLGLQPVQRM